MAEIIILAERRKARQERPATNVMAMPFALLAAYMVFGAAAYAAIVEASSAGLRASMFTTSEVVAAIRRADRDARDGASRLPDEDR
jgi:hypothetical protein